MTKVLIVDDNPVTRRMVKVALGERGFDVFEAADGKTARAVMHSAQPRIVIQDLVLPDADGFELASELRALASGDVSILAFSGFVSEVDEARMSMVGFDDVIPKPIAPARLVPMVEAHVPRQPAAPNAFGAGRRALLIDDDPLSLKVTSVRLVRLGFEVVAADSGREALDIARRELPDVIVSDVVMPELDGFGVAIAVRHDPALCSIPVVLLTASYIDPADHQVAREAGAVALVSRAAEVTALRDALRLALERVPAGAPAAADPSSPHRAQALEQHGARMLRQLERQVRLSQGLAKRSSMMASELAVLTGIGEAVLDDREFEATLDRAIHECFDAGGISHGALFVCARSTSATQARTPTTVRTIGDIPHDGLATLYGHDELLAAVLDGSALEQAPASLLQRARADALYLVPVVHRDRVYGALLMASRDQRGGAPRVPASYLRAFASGIATQIGQVLAVATAYSEREAAEARATSHAALLDAVLEGAPDAVVQLTLDGTVQFINRSPWPGIAVGSNLLDGLTGGYRDELRSAFDRMQTTGRPQGFETTIVMGDTTQWHSVRVGPITDRARIIGAVLVARDITDAKHAEGHLMVADRMASVGTLAAGIAHEINNPLASVIANLELAVHQLRQAVDSGAVAADVVEGLEDAAGAAGRVREIVRNLRVFSRPGDREHRSSVDVEDVLESTIRLAWNELRHRARVVRAYSEVPPVHAEDAALGQVFLNLLVNAAHAITPGNYGANEIRIATGLDAKGRVVVSIADTGGGIPEAIRPRLFTPFFTTKPAGVGIGLGLATTHRIVSQLGGRIEYDSEVGKGTEFRIVLPPASGARAPAVTIPPIAPAKRRGRVLIVDDEEALASSLLRSLAGEHDVTAVTSGSDALARIERGERYDAIVCDLMMPQVTGMEIYARIRAIDPSQAAAMIFMTGGAFTSSARDFLETVDNATLDKPFELPLLRNVVNLKIR